MIFIWNIEDIEIVGNMKQLNDIFVKHIDNIDSIDNIGYIQ